MTTETVSGEGNESARNLSARNEAEVLRAVARVTQARAATFMGVSASTINRTLEDLPRWAQLLASVGLQVVPAGSMVIDQHQLHALEDMAAAWLESRKFQRMAAQG